ncbi:FAD-binding molybdopterin dehydrogenase [Nakamurella flava]|uniref:FAD-binding molybdopterin dehydrogenase n=1 Tax=Nakamurella flava TaxID=2576308 RepID=A0A4U6QCG9_9ACTN|nr:FAD binding domain-containing protein [Nakamurella flava]TKV57720.1 FAD-binding molybdopterin dehydrogenase [Nakamurella flava]
MVVPTSMTDALRRAADLGRHGAFLAGGTWLMRDRQPPSTWVAVHRLSELRGGGTTEDHTRWGAMTTHSELGRVAGHPALRAVATAARTSAFPQVRAVATIGGNICARGFVEADLVPALLAVGARVQLHTVDGAETCPLEDHLGTAPDRDRPALLVTVSAGHGRQRRSGYGRITVRGGGEYPLTAVAVSAELTTSANGVRATDVRFVVGAVEHQARRVAEAETALEGTDLGPEAGRSAAAAAAAALTARDDLYAPGWYRLAVLPTVVAAALADLHSVAPV